MSRSTSPDSPPQSPMYPPTPPSLPHMDSHERCLSPNSKRPLSPDSLRDLSSPSAPLTRPASFPSPPTGHDLMLMFPPAQPSIRDVDIVAGVDRPFAEHQNRLSAFQDEVRQRLLGGTYVNTSTWFGKEERAFFAAAPSASSSSSTPKSRSTSEPVQASEDAPPAKRRKSVDSEHAAPSSYPYPARAPMTATLRLSPGRHSPYSPPRSSSASPPHPHTSPPPHTQHPKQQIPPPAFPSPTHPHPARILSHPMQSKPKRRAGKYTRRVFVHPHPPASAVDEPTKWRP